MNYTFECDNYYYYYYYYYRHHQVWVKGDTDLDAIENFIHQLDPGVLQSHLFNLHSHKGWSAAVLNTLVLTSWSRMEGAAPEEGWWDLYLVNKSYEDDYNNYSNSNKNSNRNNNDDCDRRCSFPFHNKHNELWTDPKQTPHEKQDNTRNMS